MDLNSTIGTLNDILQDIDHIPNRRAVDNSVNQHGHELIDFLNEANFCVLNGRFPEDNYTCISRKGKSVVDYICVPIDTFKNVKNFKVFKVQSIAEKSKLHEFIGENQNFLIILLYVVNTVSIFQVLIYSSTQNQLNIGKNVFNSIGF